MIISVAKADNEGNATYVFKQAAIVVDTIALICHSSETFRNQLFELFPNRTALKEGKSLMVSDNIIIVPNLKAREKGYWFIVDVRYKGITYMQLAFNKIKATMSSDEIKVKICNNVLYSKDWTDNVQFLCNALNLHFKSIKELDVAVDGSELVDDFLELYHNKSFDLVNRGINGRQRSKQVCLEDGFHFNRPTSDVHFTFYDKTQEYGSKPHLAEFHSANGLGEQVQRIELRVKSLSAIEYSGVTLSELANPDVLVMIFQQEFQKRVVFRNTDVSKMHYDKNRNKKFPTIDFIRFPEANREIKLSPRLIPQIDDLKSKKNVVKQIFLHAMESSCYHDFETLKGFVVKNRLLGWFNSKYALWGIGQPENSKLIFMHVNEIDNEPEEQPMVDSKQGWFYQVRQVILSKIVMSQPKIVVETLPFGNDLLAA